MRSEKENTSFLSDWIVRDSFFDLYDQILGHGTVEEVLDRIATAVSAKMNAEGTTIFLLRPEASELEARTIVHNVRRVIRLPVSSRSLAGYSALTGKSLLIQDAYGDLGNISPDLRFDSSWDVCHSFKTSDVICTPAMFRGEIVGVIQVVNSRQGEFKEQHLRALSSIARLVGYSLNHMRIVEDLMSMKHLEREKAKFIRVMIHELKTPVAASRSIASVMRETEMSEQQRATFLNRLCIRLDEMLDLIKDTMNFSMMHSGEQFGEVKVVDLSEVVASVCANYDEQVRHKQLGFTLETSVQPVMVRMDLQGLQFVVSNLVSNAIKYTKKGGVEVRVGTSNGKAFFTVRDTGMGIPEKEIPDLFKEFYRASNARKSKIEGTGVGLAGVKCMVDRFGGVMQLETRENEGSTFSVILPKYDESSLLFCGEQEKIRNC